MSSYDPESVQARIAFVVGRLNRRLASATGGLSHGQLSALATVAKVGPIRIAELGLVEDVGAPGITRIVAELEARGLVARETDPADGRAVLVRVTDAGLDAVLRARAARAEVIEGLIAGLDPTSLAAIEAALPALEQVIGSIAPAVPAR
jgi:DNA-binding MarR family transcriptional regulator